MGNGQRIKGSNNRKYPKPFHNYDNEVDMSRTMCAESEAVMHEFPILRNGKVFSKGMDPAADRIIVGSMDNGDGPKIWSICGLITHEGADKNKFVNCS
ncbi:Ribonuclease/ribotoxin [Aspergillus alliaceus]|uniref:ribonuclease T1 n=1 Tax=Petromyces alliaceus TaxID=209559 RepID=A0A5N6FIZ3_PETAA|nr:Ribonuclease/ribotoxin [Aspergillus alliaceus]KAB8228890.1 Ribonuclease/ribotoxin [Aspergillus alliaceus]KAE8386175.1 Ribonuclease/ribotoxin [Aspergillus alliaceus]